MIAVPRQQVVCRCEPQRLHLDEHGLDFLDRQPAVDQAALDLFVELIRGQARAGRRGEDAGCACGRAGGPAEAELVVEDLDAGVEDAEADAVVEGLLLAGLELLEVVDVEVDGDSRAENVADFW